MKEHLFNAKAKIYDIARPRYAQKMLDFLRNDEGLINKKIADVGAGTGIFSKQLHEIGNEIFAVEPNDDMRNVMCEKMKNENNFHIINGNAEATGLTENSVDAVCAAQAFHWFDYKSFAKECLRIMKQNGKVYLTWNNNNADNESMEQRKCNDIMDKYCAKNIKLSTHNSNDKVLEAIDDFYKEYEVFKFDNPIARNKENFLQMVLSASYALRPGDDGYENLVAELRDFFDKHNQDGYIISHNISVLYCGYSKEF